jgi:hypothetical protein
MDRRKERRLREPQRRGSDRTAARTRNGPSPTQGRCYCGRRNSGTASRQAGHHDHSDRHDSCGRPVGEWTRCQPSPPWRQRHGDEPHGAGLGCEATRIAERASASAISRGGALECGKSIFRASLQRDAGRGSNIGDSGAIIGRPGPGRLRWHIRSGETTAPRCVDYDPLTGSYRKRIADFAAGSNYRRFMTLESL